MSLRATRSANPDCMLRTVNASMSLWFRGADAKVSASRSLTSIEPQARRFKPRLLRLPDVAATQAPA